MRIGYPLVLFASSCVALGACLFPSFAGFESGPGGAATTGTTTGTSQASGSGGGSDAGSGGSCESHYVATILQDKPVAFYRLDDTTSSAADLSGNVLEGTYGSAVARQRPGILRDSCDRGARFPGGGATSVNCVEVPPNKTIQPTAELTIEAWFQVSSFPAPGKKPNPAIVAYGFDGSGGAIYTLDIDTTNGAPKLDFYLRVADSPPTSGHSISVEGATPLKVDTAYHAVGTYDGKTLTVYLNGIPDGSNTPDGSAGPIFGYGTDGTAGLYVGADVPFFKMRSAFHGTIEDVALYDKALTQPQVTAHYDASGL